MKDRLLKFLNVEGISYTKFADEIGVQRSSISHILSGRNKPSFDFIQKILTRYDKINPEWLIMGKGEMLKTITQPSLFDNNTENTSQKSKDPGKSDQNIANNEIKSIVEKHHNNPNITTQPSDDEDIERIVIFFKNGKFIQYLP